VPSAGPASNGCPELAAERERIREAMLDLVTGQGYATTNVEQVLERAAVSRADFKRLFAGKQDCFLQIYEEMAESFSRRVFDAFEGEREWRDGLRAAAYAAARWIRDHPRETRYGTLEMVAAGEFAQARREATLERFTAMVDAGRHDLDEPDSVSPRMAEGVIGGILGMLTKNLRRRTRVRSEDLVPDLMYLAVRPYLGHEVAREELSIPPPPEPRAEPAVEGA
jgi:AcrR family transcriptional regulator